MTAFTQPPEPAPGPAASAAVVPARRVSFRAVLIGLLCIPLNAVWVILMERVDGRAFSSTASLFFTAVFFLMVVTALNRLLIRHLPRHALHQGELLTIFSMVSIATAMAAVDFMSPLITIMGHGIWFATPENNWESFLKDLPQWLIVTDREALKGYYLGSSTLYRWEAIRAWLIPASWWTLFIMALLWTMSCLNTVLRAQWTDKERLTYPMTQLPIAMTREDGSLYRNRLFWMGFALAGGLSLINGLHNLYPSVPALTFNGFDAGQWFPQRPWNAIGWTPLAIFPFVVGLGYLLPVDLLFSCWFFFLFWRLEKVASSAMGFMAEHPKFPYIDEQMFGGYMAICLFALWTARPHLREVWQKAFGRGATISEANEPMRFRTAIVGAFCGFLFLTGFSYAAGLPLWLAAVFFLIYFAIAISVTRMRAELGPPTHDLHFIGPGQTLNTVLGTRSLDGPTLGVFALYYWFNRAYRAHPMPHQLEAFKMAQVSGTSQKGVMFALLLAALAGIFFTFWVTLHVSYEMGAAGRIRGWASLGYGTEAFNNLAAWRASPARPDTQATFAMFVGFVIASVLMILKLNIYGWPFHALGFSISGGWSMMWAWLSLFVAWVLKSLILRYSGLRGYRAGLPFFFGVILGDFLIGGIWTLLGLILDIPIYSLWSG
jgi:hypothetical protein